MVTPIDILWPQRVSRTGYAESPIRLQTRFDRALAGPRVLGLSFFLRCMYHQGRHMHFASLLSNRTAMASKKSWWSETMCQSLILLYHQPTEPTTPGMKLLFHRASFEDTPSDLGVSASLLARIF
jgi:hypothetical protein